METITLAGQLVCNDDVEIALVTQLLPRHIELTRAEPGCISFNVTQTSDPHIWDVNEQFSDAASFELHQARVKASDWGRGTAEITRRYSVSGP